MHRTKVLYVITKHDVGGAQKYVRDLAANLEPGRFEAKILYGGNDLRWLSNRVSPLLFWNDWLAIAELVRAFRRERPDVIHLNSSKAGVIGSFAAGIYKATCPMSHVPCPKVVFTAHGWVFNPSNYYSPFVRWAYRMLHRIAARFQDTIINVSEYDRNLAIHSRIAPPEKLVTIHNGIDPNIQFLDREAARKEILNGLKFRISDFGFRISQPWVGSIGRLTREKDYGTLIAAAREVPNAYFFVIGDGPEKSNLQLLIARYQLENRFFLVPPQDNREVLDYARTIENGSYHARRIENGSYPSSNVEKRRSIPVRDATFLKAFDVFTLSSIKEGLPYTLLEAMAAGVPAVVTDAGGMPEVARACGGAVMPKRNAAALAASIAATLTSSRAKGNSKLPPPFTLEAMRDRTSVHYG